jgi:hypothetical protein
MLLVLCLASISSAASVELKIDSMISGTQCDDYMGIPSYEPSTWLKIGFVAHGFPTDMPGGIFGLETDISGTGGSGASPGHNAGWQGLCDDGTPGAAPSILSDMDLNHGTATSGMANEILLAWVEFHVPDLPFSTIITLTAENFRIHNAFNIDLTGYTGPDALEIHICPEPMTVALLGLGGLFLRRRK